MKSDKLKAAHGLSHSGEALLDGCKSTEDFQALSSALFKRAALLQLARCSEIAITQTLAPVALRNMTMFNSVQKNPYIPSLTLSTKHPNIGTEIPHESPTGVLASPRNLKLSWAIACLWVR